MRRVWFLCFIAFATCAWLPAQAPAIPATPPPQTARQALIEMFLGKGPDDFAKHLPETARQALIRKGDTPETSAVLKVSMIGRELVAQGGHVETFDVGPNLLITEKPQAHEKVEVTVEHDSLMGEDDEIELSFHWYKEGQPQTLPVLPRLIFTLKQEKEIWRLTEITAAAHVPLTDPDYLKMLRTKQDEENESQIQARMNMIVVAENNYTSKHPDRGYSCALATLFAPEPGAAPGEGFYDPGQGSEEYNGYRFKLYGCEGTPASKYRLTAAPIDPNSDMKAFCADESGTLKFVTAGKSGSCFSRGQKVGQAAPAAAAEE
jgi:hypothetical protein